MTLGVTRVTWCHHQRKTAANGAEGCFEQQNTLKVLLSLVDTTMPCSMSRNSFCGVAFTCFLLLVASTEAFQVSRELAPKKRHTTTALCLHIDRRSLFVGAAYSSLLFGPALSRADDDLTSQLFNPDGSLKEGISAEAAGTKLVTFEWEQSDKRLVNLDGKNIEGSSSGSQVRISYQLPKKWGRGDDPYIDSSEGVNAPACKSITVYKAAGKASTDRLDKASTIGVGKALEASDTKLISADIIGGRKRTRNDAKYYDFDMASAPETCGNNKDDLGLGFCPYDTIFLISATILDESLYVMTIECDQNEWKRGNADLKRVRSSFSVEPID